MDVSSRIGLSALGFTAAADDSGGSALTILAQVPQALGRPEETVRECREALHRNRTFAAAAVSGPRSAIACGSVMPWFCAAAGQPVLSLRSSQPTQQPSSAQAVQCCPH